MEIQLLQLKVEKGYVFPDLQMPAPSDPMQESLSKLHLCLGNVHTSHDLTKHLFPCMASPECWKAETFGAVDLQELSD